nr:MAG TPA: anaerobic nitric oxide reductase flavorubredoxin [Caudoviricetes sp.]
MMYRTRITIDPYGFASAWVCPVCEQEKTAPELEVANG